MKRITILLLVMSASLFQAAAQIFPDFTKLHFGCDGNSITAGNQ